MIKLLGLTDHGGYIVYCARGNPIQPVRPLYYKCIYHNPQYSVYRINTCVRRLDEQRATISKIPVGGPWRLVDDIIVGIIIICIVEFKKEYRRRGDIIIHNIMAVMT